MVVLAPCIAGILKSITVQVNVSFHSGLGNTNRIESHKCIRLTSSSGLVHRSSHTHIWHSGQGWYIGLHTHIWHSGQGWYIGLHAHISHSSQGWYIGLHTHTSGIQVRAGTHLAFRSGLVHRSSHTHLTFRPGLVHRSAHTSRIQVRACTSIGTHISQVRAGTSVGTRISHSGPGWYIGWHTHLKYRTGLVHWSASPTGQGWYIDRHSHLTFSLSFSFDGNGWQWLLVLYSHHNTYPGLRGNHQVCF